MPFPRCGAAAYCPPGTEAFSTRLRRSTARPAWRAGIVIGLAFILLSGCNPFQSGARVEKLEQPVSRMFSGWNPFHKVPKLEEPVSLIAFMPIEPVERVSATPTGAVETLPAEAPQQVTAEVYAVLTNSPEWRLVPDLTVAKTIRRLKPVGELAERARAVGKEVKADAVLFGTVSRYVERVGSEYGARQPASVGFELQLISVSSGKILWTGSFEQTQQPLSSNLFHWWQFWRGGPRWFTVQEFTRYGAEHMLKDLAPRLE